MQACVERYVGFSGGRDVACGCRLLCLLVLFFFFFFQAEDGIRDTSVTGVQTCALPILLSFWTTFLGFIVMLAAFFVAGGAPLHGWTGYAPLSAIQSTGPGEGLGADLWIISIAIFCIGALMGALNFITTTLDMRAKGMTMMRMPLTVWAWFVTAILGLLAFGVLLSAGILLLMDRNLGTSFFVPLVTVNGQLTGHKGGSPLLWQHLFWFFGHPEIHVAHAFCHRICVSLCDWWNQRTVPRAAGAGYLFARDLFRDRALSFDYGRGVDLWNIRGNVLLVPEDVWPHDERTAGEAAFLAHVRRRVRDFHAHALLRHERGVAALLAIHGSGLHP